MVKCEWCGKNFSAEKGHKRGPIWNTRYYCCKRCAIEGENNLTDEEKAEDNLSFKQRVGRFFKKLFLIAIVLLVIYIIANVL